MLVELHTTSNELSSRDTLKCYKEDLKKFNLKLITKDYGTIEIYSLDDLKEISKLVNNELVINLNDDNTQYKRAYIEIYDSYRE